MQQDADERTDATEWPQLLESVSMTMIPIDDPSRTAHLARVRDDVARGHYRPPAEAVAERMLAFLAPASPR